MQNVQRSFSIRSTADRLRRSSNVLLTQSIRCVFGPPLSCPISQWSALLLILVLGRWGARARVAGTTTEPGWILSQRLCQWWHQSMLGLCLMGAHTHSQTYKLTSQRPILQLLHPRRQLRYSGHGCTSLTTLRRKLPPIWGKTEFHFGPFTEFDRSARIGVWLVLHGTNIREGINALTQLTNIINYKLYQSQLSFRRFKC